MADDALQTALVNLIALEEDAKRWSTLLDETLARTGVRVSPAVLGALLHPQCAAMRCILADTGGLVHLHRVLANVGKKGATCTGVFELALAVGSVRDQVLAAVRV